MAFYIASTKVNSGVSTNIHTVSPIRVAELFCKRAFEVPLMLPTGSTAFSTFTKSMSKDVVEEFVEDLQRHGIVEEDLEIIFGYDESNSAWASSSTLLKAIHQKYGKGFGSYREHWYALEKLANKLREAR